MLCKIYTDVGGIKQLYMGCLPVRGDNPRALALTITWTTPSQYTLYKTVFNDSKVGHKRCR